jgi:peroxiredoxin Q/BCP
MRKSAIAAGFAAALVPVVAMASLAVGTKAPDFSVPATLGGKHFNFALADALKKGPVVLYFYPAAFTTGCTIEAHEFAAAMPKYKKLGASVIGVSHDDIATLDRFSTTECKKKFPVAADADQHVMRAYDSVATKNPEYASRTSYVIAPTGDILYVYSDGDPTKHVDNTLAAVQQWVDQQKK